MTLSDRIALAEKLGYWTERAGLVAAREQQHVGSIELCCQPEYLRGYEDGRMILETEGL